ncbi:hypothetical protein ACF1A5_27055 [Streptomyces sp. NPDC014864]|uniref:hypothetical protein n=1 Tax=Streptomyces sp. NPDC014864 TaxID=3364924 RepID=UPI0036F62F90
MNAPRVRRLFAMSAIGVLMAGGAAIGTASTASAAAPAKAPTGFNGCGHGGWWDDDCGYRYGYWGGYDNGYWGCDNGYWGCDNGYYGGAVVIWLG